MESNTMGQGRQMDQNSHQEEESNWKESLRTETTTTSSETDIQDGEGFSSPPKVFTNPEFAKTILLTELDDNEIEVINPNFIGEYCSKCAKKYDRYDTLFVFAKFTLKRKLDYLFNSYK